MSFLDKVAKAVGDAVDRGKKDVDQFIRIQKINSEISNIEKKVAGLKAQIREIQIQAGERAIFHFKAGTLASADLQPFADQIGGLEQQIVAEETEMSEKKAEIEPLKAEPPEEQPIPPRRRQWRKTRL